MQSQALVWVVGPMLALSCVDWTRLMGRTHFFFVVIGISLTFAAAVWALRAASLGGAVCGGMVCAPFVMITGNPRTSLLHSGVAPLMALFILTFLATRAGRARKERAHLAESGRGRTAAQVIANLGAAGLVCSMLVDELLVSLAGQGNFIVEYIPVIALAALAEATADTASSEIGQAFGGSPWLVVPLRRVPAGTDGAVSIAGSAAGLAAAALVAAVGLWALFLTPRQASLAFVAALIGWLADTLLGATLERRGILGNDLVNFSSTVIAALAAFTLFVVLG